MAGQARRKAKRSRGGLGRPASEDRALGGSGVRLPGLTWFPFTSTSGGLRQVYLYLRPHTPALPLPAPPPSEPRGTCRLPALTRLAIAVVWTRLSPLFFRRGRPPPPVNGGARAHIRHRPRDLTSSLQRTALTERQRAQQGSCRWGFVVTVRHQSRYCALDGAPCTRSPARESCLAPTLAKRAWPQPRLLTVAALKRARGAMGKVLRKAPAEPSHHCGRG